VEFAEVEKFPALTTVSSINNPAILAVINETKQPEINARTETFVIEFLR
jgi:hypothetical protein